MEPKVSILLPTYNRLHFFNQALASAVNQTYKNIEIIICDNSDNSAAEKLVEILMPHLEVTIKYYKNPQNIGHINNLRRCFEMATGDYINYLMDDDLLHPEKVQSMLLYYLSEKDISLVTSFRLTIDEKGCFSAPRRNTRKLFNQDKIIDGQALAAILLKNRANYIGEPTTVLFPRDKLDEPFGVYAGREALFSYDLSSWFNLLEKGRAVYMTDPLSYYRVHKSQLENYPGRSADSREDWEAYRNLWQNRNGFIDI